MSVVTSSQPLVVNNINKSISFRDGEMVLSLDVPTVAQLSVCFSSDCL